jgi:hypothetical protein
MPPHTRKEGTTPADPPWALVAHSVLAQQSTSVDKSKEFGKATAYPASTFHSAPWGFTCDDCPWPGNRSLGSPTLVKTWSFDRGDHFIEAGYYPIRCNRCSNRHAVFKDARRAIERLDSLRSFLETVRGSKWKYLKFVTITRSSEWMPYRSGDLEQRVRSFKTWLKNKVRPRLRRELGALGGTDVIEVVSRYLYDPYVDSPTYQLPVMERHHVHSHGVWIAPYVDQERLEDLSTSFPGRPNIRAMRPQKSGGTWSNPTKVAARELAKYLSKSIVGRRSLWGIAHGSGLAKSMDQFLDEQERAMLATFHIPDIEPRPDHDQV